MKKEYFLERTSEILGLSYDDKKLLADFLKENSNLSDNDFYKKLDESFPWLQFVYKSNANFRLKNIENHLFFFKVLAIIGIVISIIAFIFSLNK